MILLVTPDREVALAKTSENERDYVLYEKMFRDRAERLAAESPCIGTITEKDSLSDANSASFVRAHRLMPGHISGIVEQSGQAEDAVASKYGEGCKYV
jgi:hypothetical protein